MPQSTGKGKPLSTDKGGSTPPLGTTSKVRILPVIGLLSLGTIEKSRRKKVLVAEYGREPGNAMRGQGSGAALNGEEKRQINGANAE